LLNYHGGKYVAVELAMMHRELAMEWFKEPELAMMCTELAVVWFK
jgi:hypothetical protein